MGKGASVMQQTKMAPSQPDVAQGRRQQRLPAPKRLSVPTISVPKLPTPRLTPRRLTPRRPAKEKAVEQRAPAAKREDVPAPCFKPSEVDLSDAAEELSGMPPAEGDAEDEPPLPRLRKRSVSASALPHEGAAPLMPRQRSVSALAPKPQRQARPSMLTGGAARWGVGPGSSLRRGRLGLSLRRGQWLAAEGSLPLPLTRKRSVSASALPHEGAAPLAMSRQRSVSALAPTPQQHAQSLMPHGEQPRSTEDSESSSLPMLAQQLSTHWDELVVGAGMATEERDALTEMVRQAKAWGDKRLAKSLQAELDKDDPLAQMIAAAKAQRDRALVARLRAERDGGSAAEKKPSRVRQGSVVLLKGTAHLVEQVGAAVTSAAALRPPADLRATMRATMRIPHATDKSGEAGFFGASFSPRAQPSKPRPRLSTVNGTRRREPLPQVDMPGGVMPAAVEEEEEEVEEEEDPQPALGAPEAEAQRDGGLYRACSELGDALLQRAEEDSVTDRKAAVDNLAAAMSAMMHSEAISAWEQGKSDAATTKIKEALVFDEHDQVALALAARFATAPPPPDGDGGLPAGWEEQYDDEGSVYYYNTYTGVSQWALPGATEGAGDESDDGAAADMPDLPASGGRRLPLASLSLPSAGAVMSAGAKISADVNAAILRPFGRRARGTAADAPASEQPGTQPGAAPSEASTRPSVAPAPSPVAPLGVTPRATGAPFIPLPRVTERRSSVELDASDRRSSSDRPAPAGLLVPTLSAEDRDSITRLQQLEQRLRLSTMAASEPRSRSASKDGEAPAIDRSCSTLTEMLRLAKVSQ